MGQPTKLELAVNHAISERQSILERQRLAGLGNGYNMSSDTKRPSAWCEYGFPNDLTFWDYLGLYERHGIAHGAVHILLDKCWQDEPWIVQGDETNRKDDETPWEADLRRMFKRLQLWRHFKDADRRRMVGHYGGLILQVADNLDWQQPLERGGGDLVKVIPAWEGQLRPAEWDNDPTSPRYGEVRMWQYTEANVQDSDRPGPGQTRTIHWSRVVIIGDYHDGVPLLRAGYNDAITLEKISGGSGETFLKNASRQIAVNFDKDVNLDSIAAAYGVSVDELSEKYNDAARDLNRGNDAMLITQGASTTPLVSNMPDADKPFGVALQSFAASVRLASKVIAGNQTGERASTEDVKQLNSRGQGRRESELTYDIQAFVERLMEYGLIDQVPEFTVAWTDLNESSMSEKLEIVKSATEAIRNLTGTGVADGDAPLMDVNELRDILGLQGHDDETMPGEGGDNGR